MRIAGLLVSTLLLAGNAVAQTAQRPTTMAAQPPGEKVEMYAATSSAASGLDTRAYYDHLSAGRAADGSEGFAWVLYVRNEFKGQSRGFWAALRFDCSSTPRKMELAFVASVLEDFTRDPPTAPPEGREANTYPITPGYREFVVAQDACDGVVPPGPRFNSIYDLWSDPVAKGGPQPPVATRADRPMPVPPPRSAPVPRSVLKSKPKVGANFRRIELPADLLAEHKAGEVQVAMCVDQTGLLSNVRLVRSSGVESADAIVLAGLVGNRMEPAIGFDDKPITMCDPNQFVLTYFWGDR